CNGPGSPPGTSAQVSYFYSKELLGLLDGVDKAVDLLHGVVEVERCPCRRLYVHATVQWPRAVVTHADGHALIVENLTQVMRVDTIHGEAQGAATVLRGGRTHDLHTGNTLQLLQGVGGELMFMGGDGLHADLGEHLHRGTEPDNLAGHLGARL